MALALVLSAAVAMLAAGWAEDGDTETSPTATAETTPVTGEPRDATAPTTSRSGAATTPSTNLGPGEYGMVCFVPAPDGEPHAYKRMAAGFTVG